MSPTATSWLTLVVGISSPGTAEQVTQYIVPEGMAIGVTARRSNTGNMYVADSQTNAQTAANRKNLIPGQSTTLYLDDTSKIWVDADNSSDRIEIVVQRIPSTGG